MPCTAPIITLLEPFRCLFMAPTWKKMLTLRQGTLLALGRFGGGWSSVAKTAAMWFRDRC